MQERWDRELEKGVRTPSLSLWDGAELLRDFAPGEPLLQHKRAHTHTGRRDDITTWLCVSYLGPFNYYYYYYFSFPFLWL